MIYAFKMFRLVLISLLCFAIIQGTVVRNVRLIDPVPYMINVITETVRRIEELEWCNLKIPDISLDVEEIVFGKPVAGTVSYKNGFVVSIQQIFIIENTLGQSWRYNRTANTTTVEITGTMRMTEVNFGFDVEAHLSDGAHRYTSKLILPVASFDMRVIRDMFTNTLDVSVTPLAVGPISNMIFLPTNNMTDILSKSYDIKYVSRGIELWASELLRPYALDLVENVLKYPTICYDCPVQ